MPLRSFTHVEMTLTERRRLERPLLGMVWLGVVGFSLAEGSFLYVLLGTAAVLVNLWAVSRGKEIYVSRLFVNLGVILATGVLLLEVFHAKFKQPALVVLSHYLILIQLCKLFEQKRNRDYVQMLAMSMMLMMAASLTSDSLYLAIILGGYLVLACYTTMVFILKRELDAAASKRLVTEPSPPSPQRVAWNVLRDWPGRKLRRLLPVVVGVILVGGVGVFVAAPRGIGAGLGLLGKGTFAARSGYSGNVELGQASEIYLSDRVVMRVHLTKDGKPVSALGPPAFLRGQTFDQYSSSRWTRSSSSISSQHPSGFPLESAERPPSEALVQEVSMVRELLPRLFASYPAVAMDISDADVRVDANMNYTVSASELGGRPLRYTAYSWAHPLSDAQRGQLSSARAQWAKEGAPLLGVVQVTPRVAALGREWCGDLLDARTKQVSRRDELDLQIALRITERLQERCTYTLDLSDADLTRDGVEDFLFYMKRGHCEYFASALTVMCRALGVPARLASGFYLGAPSSDGNYVVRERDAHAWTEVFTPGTDWVPIDPSPPAPHELAGGWWEAIKGFWESVNFSWYEKVVGYDIVSRERFLGWIVAGLAALAARLGEAVSFAGMALWEGFKNLVVHGHVDTALFVFAATIGLIGLLVETVLIVRALRRRRRSPWKPEELAVPNWQLGFVTRLFALLARRGLKPGPGQTALGVAREAAQRFNLPEDLLRRLIDLYYRLRWGGISVESEEIRAAEDEVARLKRTLSG